MKVSLIAGFLLVSVSAPLLAGSMVECNGTTVVTEGERQLRSAPFRVVLDVGSDFVEVVEGGELRDATRYVFSSELTNGQQKGFYAKEANLFLYPHSGAFKIFSIRVQTAPRPSLVRETLGKCKKFERSTVFD